MIVLPYSELAQTHMKARVFGSGSHTKQVRRRLVPRFFTWRRGFGLCFPTSKELSWCKRRGMSCLATGDFVVTKSWVQAQFFHLLSM